MKLFFSRPRVRKTAVKNSLISIALLATLSTTFPATAAETVPHWKGDLRYRVVQQKEGANDSRLYQQIRARLGFKIDIDQIFAAELRLATASSAISNNQALGDESDPGMARRTFGVDQAFGTWKISEGSESEALTSVSKVRFGRVSNPFFTPGGVQVLFDSDLAFEGVDAAWATSVKDPEFFANVGGFILSENYDAPVDTVDTGLVGVSLGSTLDTASVGKIKLRVARHHFLNVAGRPITSLDRNARVDSLSAPHDRYRGNSVYAEDPLAASKTYLMKSEFTLTNAGFEWHIPTGTDSENGFRMIIFGDWVQNDSGGDQRDAFETGAIVSTGSLKVVAAVASKNSDSLLGAFTDSDFMGGGTDVKGAKLGLSYLVSENAEVALTSFLGSRGVATTTRDYNGQQLDFSLRF